MSPTREFLFEIGTEEMPSSPLIHATKQLSEIMKDELKHSGLSYGSIEAHNTPRRLVVMVHELEATTKEIHQVKRGPAASIAFDASGNPTKAAIGFAKKAGVSPDSLIRKTDADGKEYVFGEIHVAAKRAEDLLGDMCLNCITKLEWPNYRSQRWGSTHESFVRPIRSLCALLDDQIIPVTFADQTSSNTIFGHRVLACGTHVVASASQYLEVLHSACIALEDEREKRIRDEISAFEQAHAGLHVDTPKATFNEVVNLCEWPHVVIGEFDHEFLSIPHEIICESMLKNQRYFPIYNDSGELTPYFVIVSNADPRYDKNVIDGNERVVRARLSDAQFFYTEDLKTPLEQFIPKLSQVIFQKKLGSMEKKVMRMEALARKASEMAGADAQTISHCERAAHLAKADLVSQSVIEFTSQQGVMGGYFARASHEAEEVAQGIEEHYRPRFSNDAIPESFTGKIVSIADKLDTIVGMFSIQEPPTGSSDPFALRRGALGIIAMLQSLSAIDLHALIDESISLFEAQEILCDHASCHQAIAAFFAGRLATMAKDKGISHTTIAAISALDIINPHEFFARACALEEVAHEHQDIFEDLSIAYSRASHLKDDRLGTQIDETILDNFERALLCACIDGQDNVEKALSKADYKGALYALADLRQPIDDFFDHVRVMDEDTRYRENRLRLLNRFCATFKHVADIAALTNSAS